jgi:hypothetical protein
MKSLVGIKVRPNMSLFEAFGDARRDGVDGDLGDIFSHGCGEALAETARPYIDNSRTIMKAISGKINGIPASPRAIAAPPEPDSARLTSASHLERFSSVLAPPCRAIKQHGEAQYKHPILLRSTNSRIDKLGVYNIKKNHLGSHKLSLKHVQ